MIEAPITIAWHSGDNADKTFICTVIHADECEDEFELRGSVALFRVTTWDAEDAASRAVEAWDGDSSNDKSDGLCDPLFVEVAEDGSAEVKRFRVSSVVRREYSTLTVDQAEPWPVVDVTAGERS